MSSFSQTPAVNQPLSFSHLFLQLLLEATDSDLINHAPYIISLVQQSASFEANKQISDDILKTVAHNCLNQQQTQSQITTQLTNLVNAGNQPLSQLFQRFANLFLHATAKNEHTGESVALNMSTEIKQRISVGLSLLDLFIAQCDFSLLQSTATYLHQILFNFLKQQQTNQIKFDTPLPTSLYLRTLHLLSKLYIRASTPGWNSIFQSLPAIRSTLDSLFVVAMKALPFSPHDPSLDGESSPHFRQLQAYNKPIQTITPGAMAVFEYVLHILLSLYQHNATRPVLKTHLPQTFTLLFSLCDLDIHSQSYNSMTSPGQTINNKLKSSNSQSNRLLPLMGQVFALACYSAKFNDVKQSLTNFSTSSKDLEPMLLAFPSDIFLLGLQAQVIQQKAKKEQKSAEELANKQIDLDTFLATHQNDDGNGIMIDTTKSAKKAISGLSGDINLSLTGGTVTKHLDQRQMQGSAHALQLKVAHDDKIAEDFLTDEFQSAQQVIYNRQQQILHLDLKRCIVTMLVTTIVNHLLEAIPSIVTQHSTLSQLSSSLLLSQRHSGFISDQPLAFVLPSLPQHINTESLPHQQLLTSRTLALFSLLQSLLTISPTSLQQSNQISSAYNNLQWLGFGGAGATFLQSTHREIFNSTAANKHTGVQQFSADKSGTTSATTGSELDQIVVITPPSLPTSLAMSFGTQNEQLHVQQQNQQHFQFEFPLFRVLQLFYIVFEIELNTNCVSKELFYLNQLLVPLQISSLSTFQYLLQSTAKHSIIYIQTFIPSLFAMYQTVLNMNRSTYLLANINYNLLQQHLLSTFTYLLSTYSYSVIPQRFLTQLIPIILFDLMTYIHDLTRVQQQYKFVNVQKETQDLTKGPNQQKDEHSQGGKTTIPLSRVVQAISAAKGASFSNFDQSTGANSKKSAAAILTGATINSSKDTSTQSTIQSVLTNPSRSLLTPHTLHVPTLQQQQSRESVVVDILRFFSTLLTTSTSSMLLTNDIFVAIARSVVVIIHTFLTPQGGSLLPLPNTIMMNIFSLLNQLAQFTPRIGCLSPILGESMIYFTWLLHSPVISIELQTFAKQCISQLATLVSPSMIVPSLPVEAILSLDQIRDRTLSSLALHSRESSNSSSTQFSYTSDSVSLFIVDCKVKPESICSSFSSSSFCSSKATPSN